MFYKNVLLFISAIILCAGCGRHIAKETAVTTTPGFVTATLPSIPVPQAAKSTQTSAPPAPVPEPVEESNPSLVDGTTITQVNVRAEPSTASKSLGMIGPFVKVQLIGRDESRNWYQLIYAESETGRGWVRAEYVQVNSPVEIPLIETFARTGAGVSGIVTQKINVRNRPGIEFEQLGVLNSNDVIFITGKNPGGAWIQIEFADAPDGKGWVTAEFLQAGNIEGVPIIGAVSDATTTPTDETNTPNAIMISAIQDGDSMQSPLAVAIFSATGSRALQVNGDVSAPDGDAEDWIQFSTQGEVVSIQLTCSSNTLRLELWKDEKPVEGPLPSCGKYSFVIVASNSNYFLRISESNSNELEYTNYILSVENIH